MLKLLIELLRVDEFTGISENIDIAKGQYKLNTSVKESWKQAKRKYIANNTYNGRKESN
jgi:hypothetical protein